MRKIIAGALLAALLAAPALAQDHANLGLKIGPAWSRPANAGGTGAGFVTIQNTGATPVTLVAIATPRARSVTFHRTVEEDGMFTMQPVPAGFVIPPRGTLVLAPGGAHAMLMGLTARNTQGATFPATLTFRRGASTQTVSVNFTVTLSPPGASESEHRH